MTGHIQASKLITTLVEDPEIDIKTLADRKNDKLPAVIGDPYCRKILEITQLIPKSAVEIYSETRIPISTVYRRIQVLCDIGLVKTSGSISEDGKKYFLYKSIFKEINLKFNGSLEITVIPNRSE